VLKYP
jgi:hypothetical protein